MSNLTIVYDSPRDLLLLLLILLLLPNRKKITLRMQGHPLCLLFIHLVI